MAARLKERYEQEVVAQLHHLFGYQNPHQIPRIDKVVVNMGVGEAIQNSKILDSAVSELALITGQKPLVTKSKKSIANFKLRAGMSIGCKVTLRKDRMYEFLDRLMNIALPRVRDFKGVTPHAFDGRGNYALGIREHIIFPEVSYEAVERVKGVGIIIVTTARTDEEARHLLTLLGMPFREA
ncbi:MAG: 50S ribosomal protein L5 [Nitrospinae bacterium]|nr:50S ribosomal protein L5 [Nitrospinota bacterium]